MAKGNRGGRRGSSSALSFNPNNMQLSGSVRQVEWARDIVSDGLSAFRTQRNSYERLVASDPRDERSRGMIEIVDMMSSNYVNAISSQTQASKIIERRKALDASAVNRAISQAEMLVSNVGMSEAKRRLKGNN